MANKKHIDPHDYLSVSVPITLIEALRTHCHDPLTGKPKHGMQSKIVQALLNGFLAKQGVTITAPQGSVVDTFEVSMVRPSILTPAQSKGVLDEMLMHGGETLAVTYQDDDLRRELLTHLPITRYQMPETF